MSSLSVRPVCDKIAMIMVTCLQSDLSGSRKFAPGSSCRKYVSGSLHRKFEPAVCAESSAGPSGGPSFVIRVALFASLKVSPNLTYENVKFHVWNVKYNLKWTCTNSVLMIYSRH